MKTLITSYDVYEKGLFYIGFVFIGFIFIKSFSVISFVGYLWNFDTFAGHWILFDDGINLQLFTIQTFQLYKVLDTMENNVNRKEL